MNFEPDFMNLSQGAADVMEVIKNGLKLYEDRGVEVTELTLYPDQWDRLDSNLKKESHKAISLRTHKYRGVKIVRLPK
jgi:hypothetical protein